MFGRRKDAPALPIQAAPVGPGSFVRLSPRSPNEALKPTAPPPPPLRIKRPRGGLLSAMSSVLTLGVVVALGVLVGVTQVDRQANQPGSLAADKVVLIPRNTGTSEIAALLKREGVVDQPFLFELYALLNRSKGQLKAGEFQFKARTSMEGAIATLIEGKPILHSLTVPEGLTSEQIVARLRDNEILSGDVTEMPREGSLMPDTYRIERGMTRQQLVNRMAAAQREALNAVWAKRSPEIAIRTPQELVILASIVEKEAGKGDERPRVAGVFHNRLAKRMKLQSDPTIVYGLVGGKATLGRGISKEEITRPTPYNTYVVEGLPPGPIANPGRAALEAAANPARTKDLYFVANGTGGHAFAETYDQHLRNVARWRQIEREREAREPGAPQVDRVDPAPTPEGATAFAPVSAAGAPGTGLRPAAATPAGAPRARGVDAVEGTPRDPLLNKTFDLNSPKTVPTLRQP